MSLTDYQKEDIMQRFVKSLPSQYMNDFGNKLIREKSQAGTFGYYFLESLYDLVEQERYDVLLMERNNNINNEILNEVLIHLIEPIRDEELGIEDIVDAVENTVRIKRLS